MNAFTSTEDINLRCPTCGHAFTQPCPVDPDGTIQLEDDLCPVCGTQAHIDPP